nr:MAG TPA: hypothetical protein [Caudoviricetes sp.]
MFPRRLNIDSRHIQGYYKIALAVTEDSATLRSDMSAVYGVGGESDATTSLSF